MGVLTTRRAVIGGLAATVVTGGVASAHHRPGHERAHGKHQPSTTTTTNSQTDIYRDAW